MKKHYFGLFLAIILMSFLSCKKEQDIPNPDPTEEVSIKGYESNQNGNEIKMNPNVIYIKDDINNKIVSLDDNGLLTIQKTDALNIIKDGDILYSMPTEKFPDGYALKIISKQSVKSSVGSKVKSLVSSSSELACYETRPASISEVYNDYVCTSQTKVNTNIDDAIAFDFLTEQKDNSYLLNSTPFGIVSSFLPEFEMKNILDSYKLKHFVPNNDCKRFKKLNIGSDETTLEYVIYDLDGKYCTENDQVVLEMKLNYEFTNTKLEIHGTKFNFKGNHKWSSQATLKYEYDKDWTENDKKQFKEKFKGEVVGKKYNVVSIPITLPSFTDLVIKPTFDVFYELKLDLSGNIKIVAGVKDYEYSYNINNQQEKAYSLINEGKYFSDIEIGGNIDFGVRFGIGFTTELPAFKLLNFKTNNKSYAGVYADFGADASVKVNLQNQADNTACFTFNTDYTADAGVYLEYKLFFINDFTLNDKIPIYTSPSYTGKLAEYKKCIPNDWLPKTPDLVDSEGYEYKTVKIGDQIWSAENWREGQMYYNNDKTYGCYSQSGGHVNGIPTGWRAATKDDFDKLLSFLSTNAFISLTSESSFNAKPYGFYSTATDVLYGANLNGINEFEKSAVFVTSTFDHGISGGGGGYYWCLNIDFINKTVSVGSRLYGIWGNVNSAYYYYNVRLIKE